MKFYSRFMIIISIFCVIILSDCVGYPVGPGDRKGGTIRGVVTDRDGHPIETAGIVIDYILEYEVPIPGFAAGPEFPYQIPAAEETRIKIWVERYCTNEHIITLTDTTIGSGFISEPWSGNSSEDRDYLPGQDISWNGTNSEGKHCLPGVYNVIFYTETSTESSADTNTVFMKRDNYYSMELSDIEVNTLTGSRGRFSISQECLPFGYTDTWIGEGGDTLGRYTVSRNVYILAFHNQFHYQRYGPVPVDKSGGVELEIQMSR